MRTFRMTTRRWMVAVAVVAFLTAGGIFVAGVGESNARAGCVSNLAAIALAVHNYQATDGAFPPATVPNPNLPPSRRLSWFLLIFPFLDQIQLVTDRSAPWDSAANRKPLFRWPEDHGAVGTAPADDPLSFRCPAHRPRAGGGVRPPSYVGVAGLGVDAPDLPHGHPRAGVFGHDRRTRFEDVTDGTANTVMIAETAVAAGPWTAAGTATVRGLDPARRPYIGRGRQFGGTHRGGATVAMADGSVRFVSETIDPSLFEALSTISGREPLPAEWDR